jgi:hypothetical protein
MTVPIGTPVSSAIFAIAELVQLAQYDHLAQRCRECLDQLVETPQIGPAFLAHHMALP